MRARFQGYVASRPADCINGHYEKPEKSLRDHLVRALRGLTGAHADIDNETALRARHAAKVNRYSDMTEAKARYARERLRQQETP